MSGMITPFGANGSAPGRRPLEGNIRTVKPGDDLQTAYDWLKSASRDAAMGALSATNPRTLILMPGTYTLTGSGLLCDTDYISIVHNGLPEACIVTSDLAYTLKQTCDTMHFSGFTVRNTNSVDSTRHGFVVDATSNAASTYRRMHYRHASPAGPGVGDRFPMRAESNLVGLWIECQADSFAWRTALNMDFAPEMWYCEAGTDSFGGDNDNNNAGTGEIGGKFYFCKGGAACFGGCTWFGMDCNASSYFYRCEAGDNSFAMGKNFAGTAIDCVGGRCCFGGTFNNTYKGTFSGEAINCSVGGGALNLPSFGMKKGTPAGNGCSGRIVHCRYSSLADFLAGTLQGITCPSFTGDIKGCHPTKPAACSAATTVTEFYNGHTYTNATATGAVPLTLPPAKAGLEYTFAVAAAQQLSVDPDGTDTLEKSVGSGALAAGEYIHSSTLGDWITLKCFVDGAWTCVGASQAWTEESP